MNKKGWKKSNQPTQKERVEQLIEVLEKGVADFVFSPDHFKAILEMKAIMPGYSFQNLLVVLSQLPTASFIAGFKHWKTLGRNVKKGQTALRIFAPRFVKNKDKKDHNSEDHKLIGFITVPVFDYSQTEGDPLPIDRTKILVEGDSPRARELIKLAEQVAKNDNCPVTYGDGNGANGFYIPSDHSITVEKSLPINHQCKTLIHELVHSKVDRYDTKSTSEEKEVVAEGTAFVVCSYFGLDTSDYSFHYVKSWSKKDDNALLTYGTKICNVAKNIISEFETLQSGDEETENELSA